MDIVFDIDGTLASANHRLHLIMTHGSKDWETFLSQEMVDKDTPIPETWLLMKLLIDIGHMIIFITGRKESTRAVTSAWLQRSALELYGSEFAFKVVTRPLYMRTDGDRRESYVVKEESLHQAIRQGYDPKLAFEDRTCDAKMWRRNDIRTCQVAEGNF